MTDLLKDTLVTRANATDPPPLDLDAIAGIGTRRIRRRRFLAVTGTAALTAGAVVTGYGIVQQTTAADPDPAAPTALPFAERRPTYANRGVIHYGRQILSIGEGEHVNQFVQTDAGFVYATMPKGDGGLDGKPAPDGSDAKRSLVTLLDHKGRHVIGGRIGRFGMVAGHGGSLVGWHEQAREPGKIGNIVLYDTAARREVFRFEYWSPIPGVAGSPKAGAVVAIDGQQVYFGSAGGGLYQVDLTTKRGRDLRFSGLDMQNGWASALDAAAGKFLYVAQDRKDIGSLFVGADLDARKALRLRTQVSDPSATTGTLSPGAKYVITTQPRSRGVGETDIHLYSAETGRRLTLDAPSYRHWRFGQWMDAESFVVAGIKHDEARPDLLRCSARTLRCDLITADFSPSYLLDRGAAFPIGQRAD